VIRGNSLRLQERLAYKTGFDGRRFIREVLIEQ